MCIHFQGVLRCIAFMHDVEQGFESLGKEFHDL